MSSPPEARAELYALAGSVLGLAAERAAHLLDEPSLASFEGLIERLEALAAEAHAASSSRADDMGPQLAGLEHAAVVYDSHAEFIASVLPFVLGGIQRDEPVLVASHPENLEALSRALGVDAAAVDYRESAPWYSDPGSALRRYRRYIEQRSTSSRVRIVGELPWSDRSEAGVADWLRYESVINVALESAPATIVCPYDAGRLPREIVDGARCAHPHIVAVAQMTRSLDYQAFFPPTPA